MVIGPGRSLQQCADGADVSGVWKTIRRARPRPTSGEIAQKDDIRFGKKGSGEKQDTARTCHLQVSLADSSRSVKESAPDSLTMAAVLNPVRAKSLPRPLLQRGLKQGWNEHARPRTNMTSPQHPETFTTHTYTVIIIIMLIYKSVDLLNCNL